MIQALWRYITGHWYGSHGLFWSFWVNLILIRALVFASQEWLGPEEGHDFRESWVLILIISFCFHGIVFAWQAVGVIRASEAHVRAHGAMAPVWGAQLALVFIFFWMLVFVQEAWLMTVPVPEIAPNQFEAERIAKYSIEPTADGRSLNLTGSLEIGITRRLKEQLKAYPEVEQVVLTSRGGSIFEARGLSKTIRSNALNTLVTTECSSACTTVFIGGGDRQLASGARLGFHQYRIDANYVVLNADPLLEQEKDREMFLQSGVASWFVEKMFDSNPSEIWYPESSELIDARVVSGLVRKLRGSERPDE